MAGKGENFEEAVREYFARRGFYALRSVRFKFEADDVTDIDIWLYGRQPSGVRVHAIVDAKNKKSPKALERILWVKGLQAVTRSDRAYVATTDASARVAGFGERNDVSVITKKYVSGISSEILQNRMSLEEFLDHLKKFESWKSDGDWPAVIDKAKSALVSANAFQAFNVSAAAFSFFAERVQTRPKYSDQALRSAVYCASIAAIALDRGLERLQFSSESDRRTAVRNGIAFGDSGDGQSLRNVRNVLGVINENIEGGKPVAARVRTFFEQLPEQMRADVVADHLGSDANAQKLFVGARELERWAFRSNGAPSISVDTKAFLGTICDFVKADRKAFLPLFSSESSQTHDSAPENAKGLSSTESPSQSPTLL